MVCAKTGFVIKHLTDEKFISFNTALCQVFIKHSCKDVRNLQAIPGIRGPT